MTDTKTLTTAEVAHKLGTDGRTLHRYLRSTKRGVGTGKRDELHAAAIAELKKGFTAWRKEVEGEKAAVPHVRQVLQVRVRPRLPREVPHRTRGLTLTTPGAPASAGAPPLGATTTSLGPK